MDKVLRLNLELALSDTKPLNSTQRTMLMLELGRLNRAEQMLHEARILLGNPQPWHGGRRERWLKAAEDFLPK